MISRRNVLVSTAAAVAGAAAGLFSPKRLLAATTTGMANGTSSGRHTPVVTPNGASLPWRWEDGRKTFHLIAEPVVREFAPGLKVNGWGDNGQPPGPTIEAGEGDRVRIHVLNATGHPLTPVRRSSTNSRSGSTAHRCTIPTSTRWCSSRWG